MHFGIYVGSHECFALGRLSPTLGGRTLDAVFIGTDDLGYGTLKAQCGPSLCRGDFESTADVQWIHWRGYFGALLHSPGIHGRIGYLLFATAILLRHLWLPDLLTARAG